MHPRQTGGGCIVTGGIVTGWLVVSGGLVMTNSSVVVGRENGLDLHITIGSVEICSVTFFMRIIMFGQWFA